MQESNPTGKLARWLCWESYLIMVLSRVDLASLWKVMMTLVAGRLLSYV